MSKTTIWLLIIVLCSVSVAVGTIAIWETYTAAVEQQSHRLTETVVTQKELINAVARFDMRHTELDVAGGAFNATLSQIKDAHARLGGFGRTGEFVVGRRDENRINFIMNTRHKTFGRPQPVPIEGSALAEPMRRALQGRQGVLEGQDYRGATVLAAYVPIEEMNLGLVAKIDMKEIRSPFIRTGLIVAILSFMLVIIGVIVLIKTTNPVIRRYADQAETLSRSQARLQAILDTAVDGIITINSKGIIETFNMAAENIFGYQASEVIGQKINMLQPEPIRSKHDQYLQSYLQTGIKKIIGIGREVEGQRKDGSLVPLYLSVAEFRIESHRLFSGIVRDVSAQKQDRQALLNLADRLQLATDSANIGIWEWDVVADQLIWDDAMYNLYGINASDFEGAYEAWQKGVHPEDLPAGDAAIQAALNGEKEFDTEFRVVWPDGQIRSIKANAIVQRNESRQALKMIGVNWDITELKEAEVQQRKARKAAEASNRAKSEFLANMSHEIRTPLNGVMGMIELLLNSPMTDRQKEFLGMARQSAESLLSVINDILDFSKIEAGKIVLENHPFDLREVIEGTTSTMGLAAAEKKLELTCRIVPEIPDHLVGDAGRLRQVLINLLSNAIKFTDSGEIAVEVMMDNDPESSGEIQLHLSVMDTGKGIPPDKQNQIFDAFEQADASITREFGGTGLGLSISSQLVALMGGRIWVDSDPGRGSTFHFTVRAAADFSQAGKPNLVNTSLDGLRILAVDDNATNRRILQEMLPQWGVDVKLAEDGPAALRLLDAAKNSGASFDLMLTDYHMPGMHGLQLAEQVRQNPSHAKVKIILLSSGGKLYGDSSRFRQVMDDTLNKPLRQSDLLESILKTTGMQKAANAGPEARKYRRSLFILLAEDSEINQVVALELLKNAGHTVMIADNGVKALEALKEHEFDAVLMDVQMPEMDGITATQKIRDPHEAIRNHNIPIIAMTAHALKGDRERCLEAGMNGYVSKPIQPKQLFEALETLVPTGNSARSSLGKDAGSEACFNLEQALVTVDGNLNLLERIIDMFLEEGPGLVDAVKQAIEGMDPAMVRQSAHKLKGTVGNFSAQPAFEAAFQVEKIGDTGNLNHGRQAFRKLEKEFDLLFKALKEFRRKGA